MSDVPVPATWKKRTIKLNRPRKPAGGEAGPPHVCDGAKVVKPAGGEAGPPHVCDGVKAVKLSIPGDNDRHGDAAPTPTPPEVSMPTTSPPQAPVSTPGVAVAERRLRADPKRKPDNGQAEEEGSAKKKHRSHHHSRKKHKKDRQKSDRSDSTKDRKKTETRAINEDKGADVKNTAVTIPKEDAAQQSQDTVRIRPDAVSPRDANLLSESSSSVSSKSADTRCVSPVDPGADAGQVRAKAQAAGDDGLCEGDRQERRTVSITRQPPRPSMESDTGKATGGRTAPEKNPQTEPSTGVTVQGGAKGRPGSPQRGERVAGVEGAQTKDGKSGRAHRVGEAVSRDRAARDSSHDVEETQTKDGKSGRPHRVEESVHSDRAARDSSHDVDEAQTKDGKSGRPHRVGKSVSRDRASRDSSHDVEEAQAKDGKSGRPHRVGEAVHSDRAARDSSHDVEEAQAKDGKSGRPHRVGEAVHSDRAARDSSHDVEEAQAKDGKSGRPHRVGEAVFRDRASRDSSHDVEEVRRVRLQPTEASAPQARDVVSSKTDRAKKSNHRDRKRYKRDRSKEKSKRDKHKSKKHKNKKRRHEHSESGSSGTEVSGGGGGGGGGDGGGGDFYASWKLHKHEFETGEEGGRSATCSPLGDNGGSGVATPGQESPAEDTFISPSMLKERRGRRPAPEQPVIHGESGGHVKPKLSWIDPEEADCFVEVARGRQEADRKDGALPRDQSQPNATPDANLQQQARDLLDKVKISKTAAQIQVVDVTSLASALKAPGVIAKIEPVDRKDICEPGIGTAETVVKRAIIQTSSTLESHCEKAKVSESETNVIASKVKDVDAALTKEDGVQVREMPVIADTVTRTSTAQGGKQTEVRVLEADGRVSFSSSAKSLGGAGVKTMTAATKKTPGFNLKLGIRISDSSAALIASGTRVEHDPRKQNMEEGEITPSTAESTDSTESTSSDLDVNDLEGSGMVTESDEEKEIRKRKTKKKRDKSSPGRKSKKRELDENKHKKQPKKHSKNHKEGEKGSRPPRSRTPKKRKRTKSRSRSRSTSRSRSFDNVTGVWRSRSKSRSRSRSNDRHRSRSRSKSRDRRRRDRHRRRSRSPNRIWSNVHGYQGRRQHRSRSRSRERKDERDLRTKIDKTKLRQIAIKNAMLNAASGRGPKIELKPDLIAAVKAGGKSVAELTDYCKRLAGGEGDSSSDDSDDSARHQRAPSEEGDTPFINHPFKPRDLQTNIVMNIRNARQLPLMTPSEKLQQGSVLRLQFPVSSGSQHRAKEDEWVPVEKAPPPAAAGKAPKPPADRAQKADVDPTLAVPLAPPAVGVTPAPLGVVSATPLAPAPLHVPSAPSAVLPVPGLTPVPGVPVAPPMVAAPPGGQSQPAAVNPRDNVFPDYTPENINIGDVVSQRLSALRKLQDNPHDVTAIGSIWRAQEKMSRWAESKQLPGHFTGTTGVQVLTPQQLAGPRAQAWAKPNQLKTAAPLSGGIGKFMLEKMGWKEGSGLGKNNEGSTQPLMLELKMDRKGLTSADDVVQKAPVIKTPTVKDLSGKHPVSALLELSTKRHWGPPQYEVVMEGGPDHRKHFLFKVRVNGQEFQPVGASNNKKSAKAQAATVCLQQLGLLPR